MNIEYSQISLLIRELANGALTVSAFLIVGFLLYYINNIRRGDPNWWSDPVIKFSVALIILFVGHTMRSVPSWFEFLFHEERVWFSVAFWFPLAIICALWGKALFLWALAPEKWRASLIWLMAVISIVIPVVVHIAIKDGAIN